jgi:hypothetical protein
MEARSRRRWVWPNPSWPQSGCAVPLGALFLAAIGAIAMAA